jgi:ribulose-5-phosphate 4-epimerase/fuculose-1-phosphate aldolase
MIALLALAVLGQKQSSASSDVFKLCQNLVGGQWEGHVGKNVVIRFKFHMEDSGNKMVGDGWIDATGKHPIPVSSSFGWDPDAKQVYYLDQHGSDTVYFGHVTCEGNVLVTDFNGLVGDKGHYISRESVTHDQLVSTMAEEKGGKIADMGFHLELHRVK